MILSILALIMMIMAMKKFIRKQTVGWFLTIFVTLLVFMITCFAQDVFPRSLFRCDITTYDLMPDAVVTQNEFYYDFQTTDGYTYSINKDRTRVFNSDTEQFVLYKNRLNKWWYIVFLWPPVNDEYYDLRIPYGV